MCGLSVVGVVGNPSSDVILNMVIECVENVLSRGYDSVGSVVSESQQVIKSIANNEESAFSLWKQKISHVLNSLSMPSSWIVSHTRWATHGKVSVLNAHPQVADKICVVHNGIIENAHELKDTFHLVPQSDTDTEVVALLIQHLLKNEELTITNFLSVCRQAISMLCGSWALVISYNDVALKNTIIVAKNQSPLLIGFHTDKSCPFVTIGSEVGVFDSFVNCAYPMKNGDVFSMTLESNQTVTIRDEYCSMSLVSDFYHKEKDSVLSWPMTSIPRYLDVSCDTNNKKGQWTLKEIQEQYELVAKEKEKKENPFAEQFGKHLIFIASGSSYYSCSMVLREYWSSKKFASVTLYDPCDYTPSSLSVNIKDTDVVYLFVSQSGETYDSVRLLQTIKQRKSTILVLTNTVGSTLGREADFAFFVNAGKELGVAATKTFTMQVITLIQCLHYPDKKSFSFMVSQHMSCVYLRHRAQLLIQDFVTQKYQHIFMLGFESSFAAVCEGALKIKELAYVHAEAYVGGALKHGPFALLNASTPVVIMIWPDSSCHSHMMSTCRELMVRAHPVIVISPSEISNEHYDHQVIIPAHDIVEFNLLSVVFFQWLAYEWSVVQGYDPDKPRHLAKSVTV